MFYCDVMVKKRDCSEVDGAVNWTRPAALDVLVAMICQSIRFVEVFRSHCWLATAWAVRVKLFAPEVSWIGLMVGEGRGANWAVMVTLFVGITNVVVAVVGLATAVPVQPVK